MQNYQSMEMRNRDKAKRGIERQYQIVKPDATPDEIRQVVEGGQEVQIFAQAVSNLWRRGLFYAEPYRSSGNRRESPMLVAC